MHRTSQSVQKPKQITQPLIRLSKRQTSQQRQSFLSPTATSGSTITGSQVQRQQQQQSVSGRTRRKTDLSKAVLVFFNLCFVFLIL